MSLRYIFEGLELGTLWVAGGTIFRVAKKETSKEQKLMLLMPLLSMFHNVGVV